jgi:OmpA-OmpF porin, OOP family
MTKSMVLAVLTMFVVSTSVFSQNKFWRATVGLSVGTNQYSGEIKNDFYRFGTVNPFFGLNGNYYLSRRLDLMGRINLGGWGYESENSNTFDTDVMNTFVMLKVKLVDMDKPRFLPYVFGGIGFNSYSNWSLSDRSGNELSSNNDGAPINKDELDGTKAVAPFGLGLQIQLADRVFLTIDETYVVQGADNWDGFNRNQVDGSLLHSIGINFGLCPWTDSDKDGISDKEDKCPNTPPIAKVDEFGCPIDTDKDGIADFEDNCPEVGGVLSGKGCPDADGDGFTDDVDACPSHAGIEAFAGCPDTDGDGIKDENDECPSIKGEAKFNGCADTDKDGVADPNDKCASTPAKVKVDEKGCPVDTDKDGVADYEDTCPAEAGTLANKGCPEVKEEVKQLFAQALTGIKFETGKDVIKQESNTILDNVVRVMNENPSYKLRIMGHTDNVGDPAKNLDLSDRRAKAVQKYLMDKGVAANRLLSAEGKGDKEPIADNTTKEGRAQNRRVEFKVEF